MNIGIFIIVSGYFSNLDLKEFLSKLPNGLDTEFNALIDNLSGGERQKIALARMFLSSADIWILDCLHLPSIRKVKKTFMIL